MKYFKKDDTKVFIDDFINNIKSFDDDDLSRLYSAVFNVLGLHNEDKEWFIIPNSVEDEEKLKLLKDLYEQYDLEVLQDMIKSYTNQ